MAQQRLRTSLSIQKAEPVFDYFQNRCGNNCDADPISSAQLAH